MSFIERSFSTRGLLTTNKQKISGSSISGASVHLQGLASYEQPREETICQFISFSSGYNQTTIKNFIDAIPKAIENIKILEREDHTDTLEEIGRKIYEGSMTMIKIVGENFRTFIANDFGLEEYQFSVVAERGICLIELSEIEANHLKIAPEKPNKEILEYRHKIKVLKETDAIQLNSVIKVEDKDAAIKAMTEMYNMEFMERAVQEYDLYMMEVKLINEAESQRTIYQEKD